MTRPDVLEWFVAQLARLMLLALHVVILLRVW